MDYTTIFTCIMTSITTFSVAFLGYYQSKKTKENEKYRKLCAQLDEEKSRKAQEKEAKEEARLRELEKIVQSLNDDVTELTDCVEQLTNIQIKEMHEQLDHLHTFQTDNFSYMQSLSNVVTTIGESLHDSGTIDLNSKEKITKSIETHRKTEQEIHKKLYNIVC